MIARRAALGLVAALAGSGCAFLGYGLSDYGGAGDDGGASDGAAGDRDVTVGPDGEAVDGSSDDGPASTDGGLTDARGGDADASAPCQAGVTFRRVFVTGESYGAAEVGSLAEADTLCASAAILANLTNGSTTTYQAWLSTEDAGAAARLGSYAFPYALVDQTTIVACSSADLRSGHLWHPIDQTQTGAAYVRPTTCGTGPSVIGVWTGTAPNGDPDGRACRAWTSNAPDVSGVMGDPHRSDTGWTSACAGLVCAGQGALYCIEVPVK